MEEARKRYEAALDIFCALGDRAWEAYNLGEIVKLSLLPLDTPSVEEMKIFVKSEIARWGKVVQQAGIAGSE